MNNKRDNVYDLLRKDWIIILALILIVIALCFAVGVHKSVNIGASDSSPSVGRPFFEQTGVKVYTDCELTAPRIPNIEAALKEYKARDKNQALRALSNIEKGSLKGCEIAKIGPQQRQNIKFSNADYDIEIVSMNPIDGGVEVFARAWNADGTQIGFGADGSVDIERFRIFNPPILIDDPAGDIVRMWTDTITGEVKTRTLREDPLEALKQSLLHTISTVGIEGSNIIAGSRGNTTSTFYPNANVESTSVDGVVDTFGGTTDWNTAHDYASAPAGRAADSGATGNAGVSGKFSGKFFIARGFFLFDTSSIPDTDTVSSATFSVMPAENGASGDNDGEDFITVVQSSPASNTSLVVDDFDQCGAVTNPTEGIDTGSRIDSSALVNGVYSDYVLNATGRGWVSISGITKLGLREGHDVLNHAYVGADNTKNGASVYFADQTGTTNDPKLVVVHSAASGGTEPTYNDMIYY